MMTSVATAVPYFEKEECVNNADALVFNMFANVDAIEYVSKILTCKHPTLDLHALMSTQKVCQPIEIKADSQQSS